MAAAASRTTGRPMSRETPFSSRPRSRWIEGMTGGTASRVTRRSKPASQSRPSLIQEAPFSGRPGAPQNAAPRPAPRSPSPPASAPHDSISPTSGYALAVGGYRLPEGFASQLERVTAPGEAPDVAAVLGDALRLDDARLAAFLERFAARVAGSGEPVRARELRAMLDG